MRITGICVVLGAIAIAALPPLNAFVSEWLLYRGLTSSVLAGAAWSLPAMAGVALLALIGGLAALCFVRLVGVALLGEPRSDAARSSHEVPPAMTAPVIALAVACIAMAVCPQLVVESFAPVLAQLGGTDVTATVVTDPLGPLAITNAALLAIIGMIGAFVALRSRRAEATTWGCGYLAPAARMQYTGRAFSELLVSSPSSARRKVRFRNRRRSSPIAPTPRLASTSHCSPVAATCSRDCDGFSRATCTRTCSTSW
jgi:NADH:ubiquinone oxidoreductase subunit 5 (subunit L)/multisubunit Na+/H+ antiporter MnhA subunit